MRKGPEGVHFSQNGAKMRRKGDGAKVETESKSDPNEFIYTIVFQQTRKDTHHPAGEPRREAV